MFRSFLLFLALTSLTPLAEASQALKSDCDLSCTQERLLVRAEFPQLQAWTPASRAVGIANVQEIGAATQYAAVKLDVVLALQSPSASYVPYVIYTAVEALRKIGPASDNETIDRAALDVLAAPTRNWSSRIWLPAINMVVEIGVKSSSMTIKQEALNQLLELSFMEKQSFKRRSIQNSVNELIAAIGK